MLPHRHTVIDSHSREIQHSADLRSMGDGKCHELLTLGMLQDESWRLVSSDVPRVEQIVIYYVSNLRADCTAESLTEFITNNSKAVTPADPAAVHNCSMHCTESGKLSARLTIDANAPAPVTSPNFWPRPQQARPWEFHNRTHSNSCPASQYTTSRSVPGKKSLVLCIRFKFGQVQHTLLEKFDFNHQDSN